MALVQSQVVDLFSPDPFRDAELLQQANWVLTDEPEHDANDIEWELPATSAQCQIVMQEAVQWTKVSMILPSHPAPTLGHIRATWRELCSHHVCLRTALHTDVKSGRIYNRVLRRVSEPRWETDPITPGVSAIEDRQPDVREVREELAHISIQQTFGQGGPAAAYHLTLHIRRALIDSTSLGMVIQNFALLYRGIPLGEHTPLRAYLRFLDKKKKEEDVSVGFWAGLLSGVPPASCVPPVEVGRVTRDPPGRSRSTLCVHLDNNLVPALDHLEAACNISRRILFEALWARVLSQHSGSSDVLFAVTGRDVSFDGAEHCVGLLDQVYPVRLTVDPDQQFKVLAQELERFHLQASPHAYIGYDAIAQHLGVGSSATARNAIETLITYCPGLRAPTLAGQLTSFPLALFISGTATVRVTLCYRADFGEHKNTQLLLQHFIQAVSNAVDKFYLPHTLVRHIEISSPQEKQVILRSAAARVRPPRLSSIPRLFEETVARCPTAPAVQFERDAPVTFAQLNARANQLARLLKLELDSIVPVCMDRSVSFIVTLLAILKSGAAYTVLDPESPIERIRRIVADCGNSRAVVDRQYQDRFEHPFVIEDWLTAAQADMDASNLDLEIQPQQSCYIIYTSGSTGTPKGVVLSHGAATSGMAYHNTHGQRRWLLFYNPTFSAAQRTMLSTLVHGATLILASKSRLTRALPDLVREAEVDALGITPSALALLDPEDVPSLRQITLVGENIPPALVEKWAGRLRLYNTFGLSECTQLNFGRQLTPSSNPRVVGSPADTTAAYILVPGTVELAPLGVAGELCLAGPQLASGYLNQPDRTAQVFMDSPFGNQRLYRTGDVAKMHPDGAIEILGRLDFQAKIGGQKVNPAEVDHALVEHSAVAHCATVVVQFDGRPPTLVAAVVMSDGWRWSDAVQSLRRHASQILPGYMVPSFWLPLPSIPTNPNGKIDIRQIQELAQQKGISGLLDMMTDNVDAGESTVMRPEEIAIAQCWAEALSLDASVIRRNQSFVSLGGTSLDAIKAIFLLQRQGWMADLSSLLSETSLADASTSYSRANLQIAMEPEPFSLLDQSAIVHQLRADSAVADAYPVTPLQESLLASLETGEDMYTYQRVWDVAHLDLEKLRSSFQVVFESSEILRTGFLAQPQGYIQVIRSDWPLPWIESSKDLSEYLQQDRGMSLPITGPLIRIALVQRSWLVVTAHHALFDFWSHRFLYHDVTATYLGQPVISRPPFKRFVQFVCETNKGADHAQFWKTYLEDVEPALLNTPLVSSSSVSLARTVDVNFSGELRHLGLSSGSVFYAAWAILLSHQTGNPDVVFATTLSGRETPILGVGRIDGPTLTTVPQRVSVPKECTLRQLSTEVRNGLVELVSHAHLGMRRAMSAANLKADVMDTLVNVLIQDEDPDEVKRVFRRHGARPVWRSDYTTIEIQMSEEQTTFRFSGQMEERRAQFILQSYMQVVQAFLDDPDQSVSAVDVISSAEREFLSEILSNRRNLVRPVPSLLHSRFEALAQSTPDAIAIDWNAIEQVSYSELDSRANQLARFLVRHGTKVGEIVPLMLDKSIEMMVAILGVMKAGAAYVPLSPENPMDRNHFIVSDVGAARILTHQRYTDLLPQASVQLLVMEDAVILDEPATLPSIPVTPAHLAYVIYTSGSTGLPKGVKVPHQSAAAAVESMAVAEGRFVGTWRTLQFANYVFDASVQDFFNTLSTGGTLCLAPIDELQSDLPGAFNRMQARQAILTPTVAKLLDPSEAPTLETLIVGGEPLSEDVIRKWAPTTRLLNVYGPTETSMVVTTKDVRLGGRPSNIGAPFPTVAAFLLQPEGDDLVPYGAIGELCIAGPQVTAGYMGRDDLTRAAFTTNAIIREERLYRTGDLARWLPGGEIECLGRKDNQVKIHGHRIELAEIEQAIVRSNMVQGEGALVLAARLSQGLQLAAFCIFSPSTSATVQDPTHYHDRIRQLRRQLGTLATYMVPKYILPMGTFPKLPSRKTDRKLLKKLIEEMDSATLAQFASDGPVIKPDFVAVDTDAEIALVSMWSSLFELPPSGLGKKANFLSLGGDSITAIRLAGMARNAGYLLSVQAVLKSPVLEEMAVLMKGDVATQRSVANRQYETPPGAVEILRASGLRMDADVEYTYPCPPGQAEFLDQGARNEQMWVLMTIRHVSGSITPTDWVKATTNLTKVNDILRTSWVRDDAEGWVGVVLNSTDLDITWLESPEPDTKSHFIEEFWDQRFAVGRPFIKYAILTNTDRSWDLVIKMNHAVYDGTLLRIFDDHFAAITHDLPIPAHEQFKDFAMHVHWSDKSETLAFWKQLMSGRRSPYPEADHPKATAVLRRMIPLNLNALAHECGVTLPIIFQAAYQLWLSKAAMQNDVSFDYLLSGRNVSMNSAADPQTINGTLANFLPIRMQIDPTASLRSYLQQTQNLFWAVTEHGNVGLNEIYAAAGLSRQEYGNRSLFLFQPFTPASGTSPDSDDEMRWLVMAKSQVRMYQPYALVVEVSKAVNNQHKLTIMFDESTYTGAEVEGIAAEICGILDSMMDCNCSEAAQMCVEDFLSV